MRAAILATALASSAILALAQDAPAFCPDLKRVATLAMSQDRFAPIAGKPRQGDFVDTTLSLAGWRDCSLYGATTYACDSSELDSSDTAEQTQAHILEQVKVCLGDGWPQAAEQSSTRYVVLRSALRPVSITLSTDQTDDRKHVVRLIMFVRKN